jgi:hypothetical protein
LYAFKGHEQKCQNNIKVFRRKASGIAKGRRKKERKKEGRGDNINRGVYWTKKSSNVSMSSLLV